jgi:signal transduction histidine kinase/ActR/RegA family two-component response regulator
MKKILRFICFAVVLMAAAFPASAQSGKVVKHIQIISSYGYDDAWGQLLCSKITYYTKKVIPGASVGITNTDIAHKQTLADGITELTEAFSRMQASPDAIVIVGTEAWMVLKSSGISLGNTPIVVCAPTDETISNYSYFLARHAVPDSLKSTVKADAAGYNVTGVFGKDVVEPTIVALKVLFPDTKSAIYFSERTFEDCLNADKFETQLGARNMDFIVTDIKKINADMINSTISNFTKQNAAILINSYSTENSSGYNSVYNANNVPIIILKEIPADENTPLVGGIFTSASKIAAAAAASIKQIVAGTPASSIEYKYISPERMAINKVAASKMGLKIAGSKYNILYEDHTSFISKYAIRILSCLLIILLLFAAFINLAVRKRNKKVSEDVELYKKLLRDYSTLFKNSPIGIAVFNKDGIFMEDNQKAAAELSQVIPDYKKTSSFTLFNSPYVSDATLQKIKHKEIADKHYIFKVNDNNIYQRVIFIPTDVESKEALVLLIVNNTEEYMERAEKDRINTSFLLAMDASKYGVAKFDMAKPDFAYIGTDSWFYNLKIKNGTKLDISFNHLVKEDLASVLRFVDQAKEGTETDFSKDVRIKNDDGTLHWLHLAISVSNYDKAENQLICYAVVSDIDSQKQKGDELSKTYQKYVDSTKLRNSLITNMGNELKTPLNALVGFSELLVEATPADNKEELQKYIEENNDKLLQMVQQMISVSDIESHNAYSQMAEFNLEAVFEKVVADTIQKTQGTSINVDFTKQGNTILLSDKSRVENIVQLLCDNAISFIGPSRNGTIKVGYDVRENNIYMYASDTGNKISGERRARLFDRFDHLSDESYVGQGLNLPIARSIVRSLHGEIGYKQNETGEGNTVWCIIPKNYAEASSDNVKGELENAATVQNKGQKVILIAEDNQNNFQLLNFILRKEYQIIHAHDGEEALKMTLDKKPNVVLMDIKMPKMDGFQATAAIRKTDKTTPIIAVTAYTSEKSRAQVRDGQFNGYISKPVNESELRRALKGVLSDEKEEKK